VKNIGMAIVFATLASACSFKNARIPTAQIPFAEADYKVMGKTKAETCGAYIFGIDWGHLFTNQAATLPVAGGLIPLPFIGGGNREERRAMFMALEKMPKATHLLEPRFEGSTKGLIIGGLPLFGERCATVHARGVRVEETPFSRLND
ncbi:MAG: hypothetical protein AAF211_32655, partial [Myxococcota bacterium]